MCRLRYSAGVDTIIDFYHRVHLMYSICTYSALVSSASDELMKAHRTSTIQYTGYTAHPEERKARFGCDQSRSWHRLWYFFRLGNCIEAVPLHKCLRITTREVKLTLFASPSRDTLSAMAISRCEGPVSDLTDLQAAYRILFPWYTPSFILMRHLYRTIATRKTLPSFISPQS